MADRTRFLDELRRFLGPAEAFLHKSLVKLGRAVETFSLLEHQEDALEYISELRRQGRNAILVVQPTGTGKTEVFLEDFRRLKELTPSLRALVIVPSRALREQTLERFRTRLPGVRCSDDFDHRADYDVCVQTSAFMLRHYHECDRDGFGYIVVDEAQHAPAAGLRTVLEYFNPTNLLGVTATPDRLDQKKLEDLFGEYESVLSLKDAILRGLVAPIRCFRVKSNIDLSEVRFNGRDYVKSDLQRTLVVPSRDQLIVNVLVKYFGGAFAAKQGVVFCVSLQHAERVAKALNRHGIPAQAVSGADPSRAQQALEAYRKGKLRFLCACDLLTEGWDSPQTSIVVMARPTFSQVLYTQQLGRGTRLCEGKEALYVIDVVDNYATRLQPLSLHAVLGVGWYQPFANVLMPEVVSERLPMGELEILDGLYEGVRTIEEINVFNYENAYGHLLNEEQLARELFVSTGTVTRWVKQGKIPPDQVFSFGRREIRLFEPARLPSIRQDLGLKEHDEETRREDFFELLEQRDYTFSYKIVFLLSFLKHANDRGEAALPELVGTYTGFYRTLLDQHGRCEAGANPYNRPEFLDDPAAVQRSLLQNPFEKFERKRFMYHCRDLNYLAFDPFLWSRLDASDQLKVRLQMVEDLKDYYRNRSVALEITEEDCVSLLPPKA
jgi:superfamily II DNA or RNA helicase